MSTTTISVGSADVEDRFSRYRLIHWWNQERIASAKILLVGAGALGNEILKNLALLGFRKVVLVDLDHIELSNISRSVLYRTSDIGRSKVDAAATAARDLYDGLTVQPLQANILLDVGLGLFGWADLILAGLDNREARLWINRSAWKMGRPWIDGAIEGLNGVARVFLPGVPPCYECTLGAIDWEILDRRMSCNLLTRHEMEAGKVPTTPTTSSIVAAIEVQEALKYLHGLPVLSGKGFVFEGMNHHSYQVTYTENEECLSHYQPEIIVPLGRRSAELTLQQLHLRACLDFDSADVVIDFSRDIIWKLICPACQIEDELFLPVGALTAADGLCPGDGTPRQVVTIHNFTGSEPFGKRLLSELGLPPWDLFIARHGLRDKGYLVDGDEATVLGPLAEPQQ